MKKLKGMTTSKKELEKVCRDLTNYLDTKFEFGHFEAAFSAIPLASGTRRTTGLISGHPASEQGPAINARARIRVGS